MSSRTLLALAIVCSACEGIGAPIVGPIPISDGGNEDRCSVTPACRPVRTVEPWRFEIPEDRRRLAPIDDCDNDGIADVIDVCPAVPNGSQLAADCANARAACDRLRAGETDMALADLRGCDAVIEAPGDMSLTSANLSCASISIEYADTEAHTLDLSQAIIEGSSISIGAAGSVAIAADGTTFRRAFLDLRGGARLRADGSVFDDVSMIVEAGGSIGSAAPAVEILDSDLSFVSLLEELGSGSGRVRFDRTTVRSSTISAQVLELAEGTVLSSYFDARELLVLHTTFTAVAFRVDYGAFAAVDMTDAIFAQCADLQFAACHLLDIDIAQCEPEHLRFFDTELIGANLAGGVALIGSDLSASVIGGGPTSVLTTMGGNLDAVRICDLGAAAFIGGELRCVQCDGDDFMNGTAVCISNVELLERGCQAIEFAAQCN